MMLNIKITRISLALLIVSFYSLPTFAGAKLPDNFKLKANLALINKSILDLMHQVKHLYFNSEKIIQLLASNRKTPEYIYNEGKFITERSSKFEKKIIDSTDIDANFPSNIPDWKDLLNQAPDVEYTRNSASDNKTVLDSIFIVEMIRKKRVIFAQQKYQHVIFGSFGFNGVEDERLFDYLKLISKIHINIRDFQKRAKEWLDTAYSIINDNDKLEIKRRIENAQYKGASR
jgi:hypothetical protein